VFIVGFSLQFYGAGISGGPVEKWNKFKRRGMKSELGQYGETHQDCSQGEKTFRSIPWSH